MRPPFASMFLLKLFLLSLLSITTNAKLTKPVTNKLLSEICPKTKSPKQCLNILGSYPKTRLASSLHDLGFDSLTLAISRAKKSANVFNGILLKGQDLPQKQKDIYKECRQDYVVAMKSLGEAKTAWNEKKYPLVIKTIDAANQVPISCEKSLVGAPNVQAKRANEMSSLIFDIARVVAKDMEGK
ncbi:PREDICTED: pectinesterase inhibitor-like [Erythranthe guttata]|uniref:pectinesterase inhibitor-like n=1 Tax=Erythranthe guttata TaxID=4155 RepID=UPI00064D85A8|nr:PREDICTED: pectinesterase inhibitor-like [Erythranthe guttata]|eukprot:XP_012834073.1 PREDICTED: pectinesterase inhibitor-like [Erythranthe guttata]